MDKMRVLQGMWNRLAKLPREQRDIVVEDLVNGKLWPEAHHETASIFIGTFDAAYDNIHGED